MADRKRTKRPSPKVPDGASRVSGPELSRHLERVDLEQARESLALLPEPERAIIASVIDECERLRAHVEKITGAPRKVGRPIDHELNAAAHLVIALLLAENSPLPADPGEVRHQPGEILARVASACGVREDALWQRIDRLKQRLREEMTDEMAATPLDDFRRLGTGKRPSRKI